MKKEKRYVHKNVNLLFYILFTVAGIIGSIVFLNHLEFGLNNSLILRSPTHSLDVYHTVIFNISFFILPYLIFFLGLILTIYYYWDIKFPSETLAKMIYGISFIIWIILVISFGFVIPLIVFNDNLILITNLIIISPIIIMIVILAKYIK